MFTKYAALQVLEAEVAQGADGLMKNAHRHAFDYDPRPGYLYVRSRAISSRTNDNYDNFPAEEIKKAYATFIGKPVFVNHNNENHRRARGVIVDAALHEDVNPDGSPDTWVEVLMEVDAVKFPKLAQAVLAGEIDRTSMGTDVAFSVCSVCDNRAETPLDYCQHIPKMKGMKMRRKTANGTQEEVLVYEKCYGLRFFENSLLVEEPADPTAYFLGVDDRGLAMTASTLRMAKKRVVGYGELSVPPQVDTLRDETCPVCGEADSFDGETCLVCQYVAPPDMFLDPDLEKAQEIDLRQEQEAETQSEPFGEEENPLDPPTDDIEDAAGEVAEAEEEVEDAVAEVIGDEVIETPEDAEEVQDVAEEVADDVVDGVTDESPGDAPEEGEEVPDEEGEISTEEEAVEEALDSAVEDDSADDDEPQEAPASEPDETTEGGGDGTVDVQVNDDLEALVEELGLADEPAEEDSEDGGDDEEEDSGAQGENPPWMKKKTTKESRLKGREVTGGNMRPALQALAAQDRQINALRKQVAALREGIVLISRAAGIASNPRVRAILKAAQDENPTSGGGWDGVDAVPAAEAPEFTTEETLGFDNESLEPALPDDPTEPGAASESDVSPDAQTSVESTDTVLDEPLDLNEQNVEAPVAGTDDLGEGARGQEGTNRTEIEVRIGDPNQSDVAFAETGWTESKRRAARPADPKVAARKAEGRVLAALRLARLRVETGVEQGDDLEMSSRIASSNVSNRQIQAEIDTLEKVRRSAPAVANRPRNLVPKSARADRTVPSFQQAPALPVQTVASKVGEEEILWD